MTTHERLMIEEMGAFPNSRWPVLLWRGVWTGEDVGDEIAARFREHGWGGIWRDGIYDFHHFHAEAHEALGCALGWIRLQLGGPDGPHITLEAGDVALLPAGIGHRRIASAADYAIIGAYPDGQSPDLERGDPARLAIMRERAAALPRPSSDPVDGAEGAVQQDWG